LIADGMGDDAKAAFDLGKVLIILPEKDGGETIVGEGEDHLARQRELARQGGGCKTTQAKG